MLKKLKSPVHSHLAWLAISAVYLPSFFLVNFALAQSQFEQAASSTQPVVEQVAPQPEPVQNASSTVMQAPLPALISSTTTCPLGMVCSGKRFNPEVKIDGNRFKDMKKGVQNFLNMVKTTNSQVERLKKNGFAVPELTKTLNKSKELGQKIKAAKTPEDIQGLGNEMKNSFTSIKEWMPKLPILAEFPRVIKQADKEIVKLNNSYQLDVKKIKNKKIDLTDELAELKTAIETEENILKEIKTLAKTDPEEAADRLQDDFFANLDDVWMKEKIIQIALNYGKSVSLLNTEIKQTERAIIKLKAQKKDTSNLETKLAAVTAQFKEVKIIHSTKPLDVDKLVDLIGDLMDSVQELRNQTQELNGATEFKPLLLAPAKNQSLPKGYIF